MRDAAPPPPPHSLDAMPVGTGAKREASPGAPAALTPDDVAKRAKTEAGAAASARVAADADPSASGIPTDGSEDAPASRPKTDIEAVLAAGGTRIPASGAGHGCLHDVVYPEGWTPDPNARRYDPNNPAKHYKFELDTFQRKSVEVMEAGESVMVAAHTSAGKTVVAEYAIAMALRDGQRVVYTSPLKALSNQKFRELHEEFKDVGLMTGDTVINEHASCLVMTTEVLRSMLYKGGEVMREVGWVIFDEIHYMRDADRGVVWEETIALLPRGVRYAFLSATIPNAKEFAEWIVKLHEHPCHLVYTDFRPTPLEHYIFPAGGDGIYLCMDKEGKFRQDNFLKAINAIAPAEDGFASGRTAHRKANGDDDGGGGGGKGGGKNAANSDIHKIIRMVVEKNYDPVIVFAFSKTECDKLIDDMHRVDLLDEDEKLMVDTIYANGIADLEEDDKRLPQVTGLLPILRRGLGVHHAGLLPRLKELVEVMFQEKLLKVLVATETMSTGLNMPTKTVVFTSPRKFDGTGYRWISSGEYVQMAGRAGRRGLDDRGLVILMMDERMDPAVAKDMLHGRSDPLNSAFKLTYGQITNLTRIEGAEPEKLIAKSFAQFQNDRNLPKLKEEVERLTAARDAVVVPNGESVAEYVNLRDSLAVLRAERRSVVNKPEHALPFVQPGRLARVCVDDPGRLAAEATRAGEDGGAAALAAAEIKSEWGVICALDRKPGSENHVVEVLCVSEEARRGQFRILPVDADDGPNAIARGREPRVMTVPLTQIDSLSAVRVYQPKNLAQLEGRKRVRNSVVEVLRRFPGGVPALDPEKDMKIDTPAFKKLARRVEALDKMLSQHPMANDPELPGLLELHARRRDLSLQRKMAQRRVRDASGMIMREELSQRMRVLRRLGYISDDGVVKEKGKVACEMQTAHELVATELIFNGTVSEMDDANLVALTSALVWREGSGPTKDIKLTPNVKDALTKLQDAARVCARHESECKMHVDVKEFEESFRPELMEMSRRWADGGKFSEIMQMPEKKMYEGSVVRAVRRVQECIRHLANAASVVGDKTLQEKLLGVAEKITRGIIFCPSLFHQE